MEKKIQPGKITKVFKVLKPRSRTREQDIGAALGEAYKTRARKGRATISTEAPVHNENSVQTVDNGSDSGNLHITKDDENYLDPFGDRRRTEMRYTRAVKELKDLLSNSRANLETFEIPAFDTILQTKSIEQLREYLTTTLDARQLESLNNSDGRQRKNFMERIMGAVSPLAKNLLQILKDGSAVSSCSFCH